MSLPNDIVPDRDEARRRQADDPLLGSAAAAADAAGLGCPDAETLGLLTLESSGSHKLIDRGAHRINDGNRYGPAPDKTEIQRLAVGGVR